MKNTKKGFTIIELVIVIAVIGILAGVLIPTFSTVIANANKSAAVQAVSAGKSILANDNNLLVVPEGTYFIYDAQVSGTGDTAAAKFSYNFVEKDGKEVDYTDEFKTTLTADNHPQVIINSSLITTTGEGASATPKLDQAVELVLKKAYGISGTFTLASTSDNYYTLTVSENSVVKIYTSSVAKEIITLVAKEA